MLEPLEGRVLFSAPIDTSGVALFDPNGNPAVINKHKAVWFLIHGNNMSKDLMLDTAKAVQGQLNTQWQVLIVDWSQLAYAQTNAAKNAQAVGNRVAQMITQAHLMTSRVNLIGFSMGGTVANRIAIDLKTRSTQVNRIVSIDVDVGRYDPIMFAADSNYSIAFGGNDRFANVSGATDSDDGVLLTGLSATAEFAHAQVFNVVTAMWERDAGMLAGSDDLSQIFSINNILDGLPVSMRKNSFANGYEAVMNCGNQPGFPNGLGPTSLTYVNLHRHTVVLT